MRGTGHPYSDPLEIALQRELQGEERVLWKARPLSRILWPAFAIWLFAVPWTAFSVFWTAMAFAGVDSMADDGGIWLAYGFPLFGVPFILIGLAMLSAPFAPLFWTNKRLYAVTDARVIELRLGRQLQSKSVELKDLGSIERVEGPDGAGTLKIAFGTTRDSDGDRLVEYLQIGEVDSVMKADDTIRRAKAQRVEPELAPAQVSS